MDIQTAPIGHVETSAKQIPHYWEDSTVEGDLVIDEKFQKGIEGLMIGQKIFVIFQFHKSPSFLPEHIRQTPRKRNAPKGVFATSSPIRPNPLGLSILEILDIAENRIHVIGLDMLNNTPILDIKPCPKSASPNTPSGI